VENFKPRPQIITTASVGGFNRKPLGNLSYGASKAGLMHMTKQFATMLVPYDIRANCIAPGFYYTEMTESMYKNTNKTEVHNVEGTWPKEMVPATRTGDEEDMAGCTLFLCSRAGAYIDGNVIVTDGGRIAVLPATY
jgi:NAD(P)-dependent dehydrogenase (short-subunit alcohol dehydrogenase family)